MAPVIPSATGRPPVTDKVDGAFVLPIVGVICGIIVIGILVLFVVLVFVM